MKIKITLLLSCLAFAVQAQRIIPSEHRILGGTIPIADMVEYGDELIIGGRFTSCDGQPHASVAALAADGNFHDLGGVSPNMPVSDMQPFNGGLAFASNQSSGDTIMFWDGAEWSFLGAQFNGPITSMTVFEGNLYAAGFFSSCGTVALKNVARWTGTSWTSAGAGLNALVRSLAVFDGQLYAGGDFTDQGDGSGPVAHLARWNGTAWEQVLSGINSSVTTLYASDDALWIGGFFDATNDGQTLPYVAKFSGTAFAPVGSMDQGQCKKIFSTAPFGIGVARSNELDLVQEGSTHVISIGGALCAMPFGDDLFIGRQVVAYDNSYPDVPTFGLLVPGTDETWLETDSIAAFFCSGGTVMQRPGHGNGFRSPKTALRSTIFSHSQFFAAMKGDSLFVTPLDPFARERLISPGPRADDMGPAYVERYARTWPMDLGMIWQHAALWNAPGYVMPDAIRDWPGNGDVANGEPAKVAPFKDLNGNGIYEPEAGDLPLIKGDRAVYFMMNDATADTWSPNGAVGIDVRGMAYTVLGTPELEQTAFISYSFINRSPRTYDTLFVGQWTDFDIGCPDNDFGGCSPALNAYYGYNGEAEDADCGTAIGFLEHPPAQAVVGLNAPMNAYLARWDLFGGNTLETPDQHWALLHGRYMDGTVFVDPSGQPEQFMFPDDPSLPNANNEPSFFAPPGERQGTASFGPFLHMAPGDTICFDIATVFAQDLNGNNLSSVTLLQQRLEQVQAWYDQQPLTCGQYPALGVNDVTDDPTQLHLYPDPATSSITLAGALSAKAEIIIHSATGQLVQRETTSGPVSTRTFDVSALQPGLYLVSVREGGAVRTLRFIKAQS